MIGRVGENAITALETIRKASDGSIVPDIGRGGLYEIHTGLPIEGTARASDRFLLSIMEI